MSEDHPIVDGKATIEIDGLQPNSEYFVRLLVETPAGRLSDLLLVP